MGLFNRKPIYITDRGDTYTLEDMEPTHLMNAINHHRKQIDTVDWCLENMSAKAKPENLHFRRIELFTTVEALVSELIKRDPAKDHEDLD